MDAGMLEDYIIAEDDIPREGGIYPEYTATMFIVIECYYNSIAKGYLQTFYQEQPFPFFGLDNMLIQLERIMDMAGVPSKCNEYRHMVNISSARKTKKDLPHMESDQKFQSVKFNPNNICAAKHLFSIRVYSRRNASIQGILRNAKKQMSFRSGIDVIRGIHECMSEVLEEGNHVE